jgi:hypothetical protein
MPSEILPYQSAASFRRSTWRSWAVTAIYVFPMIVPFSVWTVATRQAIAMRPLAVTVPMAFALTAAAGPIPMWQTVVLGRWPSKWTEMRMLETPGWAPLVGAACLGSWLFVVLTRSPRRWPMWMHVVLSAAWWYIGCAVVLDGCLNYTMPMP